MAAPLAAMPMIKEGVMRKPKVDFVIGVHVDPTVPAGKIGVREGPMMAAADDFTLTVLGNASHGAKPHLGVDAIVLSEVTTSIYSIVEDELILGVALVPMHDENQCEASAYMQDQRQSQQPEPEAQKSNPFTVLKDLKLDG